jgi:UDP-N-acetylmuramate dehydrogenase
MNGLREQVPLAPFTTLGVGGSARFFLEAASEEAIIDGADFARSIGLPLFVLGGGSNLLIADDGFPGLVIRVAIKGTTFTPLGEGTEVSAAAGEDWDTFVAECLEHRLAGLECLSGIPGSVGGTPIQNVGAYGQEVSDTLTRVRCYDRLHHKIVELDASSCGFSYRKSIFNSSLRDRYVVLRVGYRLRNDGQPLLRFAELRDHFPPSKALPSILEVREAVLSIRSRKGMVIDERDPDSRSAGSFFKNPVLSAEEVSDLVRRFGDVPLIAMDQGRSKIPAAWLIERAGFRKGETKGQVGISSKHSLAIVNRGSATASAIIGFAGDIRDAVLEMSGIRLQIEPVLVGFQSASF